MVLDFLTLAFGITGLDAINKLDGQLSGIRNSTFAITGAFIGASIGIERFLNTSISKSAVYKDFNLQTGLAIENLQQLEYLGQNLNLNLTADKIRGSIIALQQNIANIKLGKGDISPFIMAGVSNIDNAFSVIEQLKTSLKNLDNQTATNLITKMGLSPEFLSVIRASSEEIEAIGKSKFLSIQQIQDIDKLGRSINILKLSLINLKDQAVARLTPDFDILVNDVLKWLRDNNEQIIKGIEGFVGVFTSLTKAIGNSLKFITQLFDKITGTDNGIKYLTATVASLALSFSPILRIFSAFSLLFDDIYIWSKGGDSLFGGLYDAISKIPNLELVLGGGAVIAFLPKLASGVLALTGALSSMAIVSKVLRGTGIFLALEGMAYMYNNWNTEGTIANKINQGITGAKDILLNNVSTNDTGFEDPTIYKTASNNIANNNSNQSIVNNITNNISTNDAKSFAEELTKQIKIAQTQY